MILYENFKGGIVTNNIKQEVSISKQSLLADWVGV